MSKKNVAAKTKKSPAKAKNLKLQIKKIKKIMGGAATHVSVCSCWAKSKK